MVKHQKTLENPLVITGTQKHNVWDLKLNKSRFFLQVCIIITKSVTYTRIPR